MNERGLSFDGITEEKIKKLLEELTK